MTPIPRGADLPGRREGDDWLAAQPVETQERVLGKAGAAAYRQGEVTLPDFVGKRRSKRWGRQRYRRSLADAKAAARGRT